jgi:Helicase conserved C-terminal domain
LVSLRGNLKDRCVQAGIECVEWDSRKPQEWASIVLVTPESAVSEGFGNFINRQRAMGRLDRIVVDECHVVLDSIGGWRSRMLGLRALVKSETQLVYLTATMRPRDEGEFIRLMGLPPKEKCQWFRGRTTRGNVAYQVQLYNQDEEEEAIRTLVEAKKRQYPMPGQIIVYCDTVEKTVRLAKMMGCVCYHRQVGSRAEKSELVRQLTEGRQQVFTATNALGLGVDAPTIRVVIHVGVVRKLRDYAQESGRAGRDGLKSEAVLLRGVQYDSGGRMRERSWGRDVEEEMREFITTEGCMRVVLDREMDGRVDRVGCEEGEEKCGRCSEAFGAREAVVVGEDECEERGEEGEGGEEGEADEGGERVAFAREMAERRMIAYEEMKVQSEGILGVQGLEERLDVWKEGCQRCRAWDVGCEDHTVMDCTKGSAEEIRKGIEMCRELIQWERFSCCFLCGVPQAICEGFEANIDGGWRRRRGGFCQLEGVLVASVISIWAKRDKEFKLWVKRRMADEGIKWVGKLEFK